MDTATDMAMVQRTKIDSHYLIGLVLFANVSFAADVTIVPSVEGGLTYTDNMDLSAFNERSTEITSLIAGLDIDSKSNDGNATLAYSIEQLYYSRDSSKNERYQELAFDADKGLWFENRIRGDVSASITNTASNIINNANNDVISGNTVENRTASVGMSYQSNSAGYVDMNARVEGSVEDYEDNIGNNSSYSGDLFFAQGQKVKRYFWTTNYSYQKTIGKNGASETSSTEWDQEVGLKPFRNFSPYLHLYYEDYSGQSSDDSADSSSWGPGIKYYLDRNSFISLGYDFALDDQNSDHWRGSIILVPTEKTQFQFDYTQRFFGDAYDFSFIHSNRRWTNRIVYTEEVTNYERDLFVSGNRIEDLSINKSLTWSSVLSLRRTTFSLDISADNQQAINTLTDDTDTNTYSGEISITQSLSRKSTITPNFLYEYYDFQRQGSSYQKDYYRELGLELQHDFADDFSASLELTYRNRSSSNMDSEYEENRIYFKIRKDL